VLFSTPHATPDPRNIHANPNAPILSPRTYPSHQNLPARSFPLGIFQSTLGFCESAAVFFLQFFFVVILHTWVKSFGTCLSPPDLFLWTYYRLAPSTSLQMVGFVFFLGLLTALFKLDFILPFCCSLAMCIHHSSPGYEQQLCVNRYVSVSIYRSVCLYIYLSFYISFYLCLYPSLYLSIHLSTFLAYIYHVYHLSIICHLSICLSMNQSSFCLPNYPYVQNS